MKKIFSLILFVVIISAVFTSCGNKDKAEETKNSTDYCTLSISCATILDNADKLDSKKKEFVPSDGVILDNLKIDVLEGDTVYEVFKRACASNPCNERCSYCTKGILTDVQYSASYDSYYVSGIHQIYAGDCGSYSGWLFKINGEFSSKSMHKVSVNPGDKIEFVFSCDGGPDVGSNF